MRSTFKLSVPQVLYDDVCDACGQEFADSYLYGASLDGSALSPRTLTGYERMRERSEFRHLLGQLNLKLVKPTPFPGNGDRWTAKEAKGW